MNYLPYGEIGCWRVPMKPALEFRELPTHIFYFRPELVEISSGEKMLCRPTYYNIGAIVTASDLHYNENLLDYLVSRDVDNKLDIQEVLNLAHSLGTFMSAITANGYVDTGIVTDTDADTVEPNTRLIESLMNMYVNRVDGAVEFVIPTAPTGKNPYLTEKFKLEIPYEYLVEAFGEHAEGIVEHLKHEGTELKVYKRCHYPDLYMRFLISRLVQYRSM